MESVGEYTYLYGENRDISLKLLNIPLKRKVTVYFSAPPYGIFIHGHSSSIVAKLVAEI